MFEVAQRSKLDPSSKTRDGILSPDPKFRLMFGIQRYFAFGGLQRDLCRVAVACAERGHEVHIVSSEWDGRRPENVHIHLLGLRARTNHARSREFADAVGEFVRGETFDCLIGFNKMPGLDVYWAGDPCLAERLRQNKPAVARWLPRYRTYLALEAAVLGNCSQADVLVLSESEKDRIIRHYGTHESRLHLLPAGIDRRRFQSTAYEPFVRSAIRDELGIAESDLMILMVGSSFKTKGVDRALHAIKSLPECERRRTRLVVVGKGRVGPFERLAKRLDLLDRVVFAGGRTDVPNFCRSADLCLHPARTENSGLILIEAMFCGLPVLVTENCGYAVHVRRADAGLVCPDPFAQPTLNRLLSSMLSSEARRQWRQNALEYCRTTDLYTMVEKTVELIVSRAERNRRAA